MSLNCCYPSGRFACGDKPGRNRAFGARAHERTFDGPLTEGTRIVFRNQTLGRKGMSCSRRSMEGEDPGLNVWL